MRHALPTLVGPSLVLFLFACSENPPPAAPKEAPSDARHELLAEEEDEAQLDVPIVGLTPTQLARFNQGREVFTRIFTDATGLGPSFNSESCANCHEEPSVGGVGDDVDEDVETHVSIVSGNTCDDLAPHGGVVIQQHTTTSLQSYFGTYTKEAVPALATKVGRRSTPAIFGFGLLDAVPDATILALADPNDANGDGVSGRAHMVNGRVGKFGRKATDPSLLVFNAGAFQNEIGVTNNLALAEQRLVDVAFPFDATIDPISGPELSDSDLALANDFVRFLRPPPQARSTIEANDGRQLFLSIGCATCHVPSLKTGASNVNVLSGARIEAFTDLLLHDMGSALADICRGEAKPEEFRTEPLMGLRFKTNYMHDAGSSTVADAIARHDGEGAGSRTRFESLSSKQRSALLAYLATL